MFLINHMGFKGLSLVKLLYLYLTKELIFIKIVCFYDIVIYIKSKLPALKNMNSLHFSELRESSNLM